MVITRPSTLEDAHSLAPRLSLEDVQEIQAVSGQTPLSALLEALKATECLSIEHDGVVVGLFGINHLPQFGDNQAAIWLLTSPEVRAIKKELIEGTYEYLWKCHQRYPILWNILDARNAGHIKWCERCGFKLVATHENFGTEQRTFLEYMRVYEAPPDGLGGVG